MKIGIEFAKVALGGGERILYMLARSLAKHGHEIVIITVNPCWRNENIEFPHELVTLNQMPKWGKGLMAVKELSKVVKQYKIECLISFLGANTRIYVGAAKLNHIPVITSLRVEPVFKTFIQKVIKLILWSCDGAVFQTETVKSAFNPQRRIYRNSTVIHNPIMDDNLPLKKENSSKKEIVGIGRLTEQKNFALLVDAFAEVNPDGYTLKIFGEGHLRESLEKQIEALGMKEKILLMGNVDRVVNYIVDSDIFVLSSDWEGMPNALMESMAMGLACIATDVATGGCRELIKHGENGLLIPVKDKESLKKALQQIISDEALKLRLKNNAIVIRESHSKDVIIPQWISFIEAKCAIKKGKQ